MVARLQPFALVQFLVSVARRAGSGSWRLVFLACAGLLRLLLWVPPVLRRARFSLLLLQVSGHLHCSSTGMGRLSCTQLHPQGIKHASLACGIIREVTCCWIGHLSFGVDGPAVLQRERERESYV